jgi:lipopolysaccharide transport system permease protein
MQIVTDKAAVAQQPLLTIRPPGLWSPFALGEVWSFRDLLWALAVRDVKLRYRQTALGVAWVVLQPLLAAGIMSFVFGSIANLPSDGLPYFLLSYTGMLGWQAFNGTLTKASQCIVGNSQLVSKVYFPRLILPLSTVLSTLLDFFVGFALLLVLMGIYDIRPQATLLVLPVLLFLLIAFAVGVGLWVSALMVTYRDLQYVIPYFMQLLMYASPVAMTVSAVPKSLRIFWFLNPLTGLLEAFRWAIVGRGNISGIAIAYSVAVTVLAFILGAFAFKRMERSFADVI